MRKSKGLLTSNLCKRSFEPSRGGKGAFKKKRNRERE